MAYGSCWCLGQFFVCFCFCGAFATADSRGGGCGNSSFAFAFAGPLRQQALGEVREEAFFSYPRPCAAKAVDRSEGAASCEKPGRALYAKQRGQGGVLAFVPGRHGMQESDILT